MVRPNHTRLTTVVRTPFQLRHDRVHLDALAVHTPNTLPTDWRLARNIWMNRTLRRFFKTSQAVLLVIGCMHAKANVHGEFVPKKSQWQGPRGLNIPDAKSKAVVLFLHGSMVEKIDDTCDPNGQTPGFSVPEVIKQLAGTEVAGLEVVVFAPCDGRATNFGEPIKIEQRVAAIEQTLGALSRAGVEPSQIFLMDSQLEVGPHCYIRSATQAVLTRLWPSPRPLRERNNGGRIFGNGVMKRKAPRFSPQHAFPHSSLPLKTMNTTRLTISPF